MPTIRPLRNPPIVEALLDARFDVSEATSLDQMRSLIDTYRPQLPFSTEFNPKNIQSDLLGAINSAPSQRSLTIHDKETVEKSTRCLVINRDGVTAKQVWSYTNWNDLEILFRSALESFVKVVDPEAVIRLSTRFYNKIALPKDVFQMEQIFLSGPRIPQGAPTMLFDFYQKLGIEGDVPGLFAWVEHYLQREPGLIPHAILDIDVFWDQRFGPTWQALEDAVDALHTLKNELFFGALNDSVLKGYE